MNKIKLIVDSTSDLTEEYLKNNNIDVLPLGVNFPDASFLDGVDIDVAKLYEHVKEVSSLPKTAACTIFQYQEAFKKYIEEGYDIICISISSDFSSCYNNSLIASEEYKDKIECIDSRNLSSGIGLVVVKANDYIKQGKNIHEIAEILKNEIIPNVRSQFVVDTLEYLYKGGRCSSLSYIFGKHLHIHPIIRVKDGKMGVFKKVRGKMVNGLNELLDIFKADISSYDHEVVMITHSLADDSAKYLYDELSKIIDPKSIMITKAGCVISSHCGKGTIGILYIKK